ncbi:MAG: glucose-6-phosphate dehydrogenase [Polyangiaceae bacterium]|nr:glucose-6-phosphate dehydrogenase [Polyangiaceae bacterium]
MSQRVADPSIFIIFGGTGDLSRRKLLPALLHLMAEGHTANTLILGVSPDPYVDTTYRQLVRDALREAGAPPDAVEKFCTERLYYQSLGAGTPTDFQALLARLQTLEEDHKIGIPNRAFYMALPPDVFVSTVDGLGAVGLNRSLGFTRIVVEKPFGTDLESARGLNHMLHRHFDENQIYRIDHYLGKDTVQNLLVFRFANAIFESLWNRDRVESVEITVAEDLGVGTRARYYDRAGAIRDMVQNHLMQVLTLFAMEVPTAFRADSIRNEKVKVLHSLAPLKLEKVVLGQYTAGAIGGHPVPGYLEEEGILPDSQTPTFVAMEVRIDNWRWQGVPFYLRTGKRLPRRASQIAVRFRDVPVSLFRSMGTELDTPDVLLITLQPDEGFSLHFDVKVPGPGLNLRRIPLSFKYKDVFTDMPEAYETLLLDVLLGDQTLFVHAEEVEESWRFFSQLLQDPPPVHGYAAGTVGPREADQLAMLEKDLW